MVWPRCWPCLTWRSFGIPQTCSSAHCAGCYCGESKSQVKYLVLWSYYNIFELNRHKYFRLQVPTVLTGDKILVKMVLKTWYNLRKQFLFFFKYNKTNRLKFLCVLYTCIFRDLNEASLLWNLKIRYDKELIYVSTYTYYSVHMCNVR